MKEHVRTSAPLALFCLYFINVLVRPVTYQSAAILLITGGLAAFFEAKSKHKELEQLKEQLKTQSNQIDSLSKDFESIKTTITGVKLATGMRTANNGR